MAYKAVKYLIWLFIFFSAVSARAQQMNPDSVINLVFKALTGDEMPLPANFKNLLLGPEWEALAYWDTQDTKQLDNMQEAVGDVYQFQPTSFTIKLVDPNNAKSYLSAITGSLQLESRTIVLTSSAGKELRLLVILVDENYLVTEMDGLRIFYTKSRSYNAQ